MTTTERFTAASACPACKTVAVHALRTPRDDYADRLAAWENDVEVQEDAVWAWGGEVVRRIVTPPAPVDETQFEVIRICQCGHEWGQEPIR
ncbi:hypothetical protein [Nocardia sp. CC227C]|uniref:hypothetical protein n=1 Tax=Nocardia sp. CC227C TaxID=3044562 RepID=UPI00278BF6C6|nr:hypothetical protein [Nocardia sp. CC227C]